MQRGDSDTAYWIGYFIGGPLVMYGIGYAIMRLIKKRPLTTKEKLTIAGIVFVLFIINRAATVGQLIDKTSIIL